MSGTFGRWTRLNSRGGLEGYGYGVLLFNLPDSNIERSIGRLSDSEKVH